MKARPAVVHALSARAFVDQSTTYRPAVCGCGVPERRLESRHWLFLTSGVLREASEVRVVGDRRWVIASRNAEADETAVAELERKRRAFNATVERLQAQGRPVVTAAEIARR